MKDSQNRISGVIITYNEEKNISRCIDSIKEIVDEIVVIDSFSSDTTEEICINKGVRFIQNKFQGHIEQKNFALQQSKYNYVLSLDADEALSPALQQSILKEKATLKYNAYKFNRLTSYCGKWIKHCGWYPDEKIRLWNKDYGIWGGVNPHDKVTLTNNATIKKIQGDLLHFSFYTIEEHIKQIELFTTISANAAFNKNKKSNLFLILFKPCFKFCRDYIIKLGFLDGFYGLIICLNSAFAKYLKYLKLYQLNKKNNKI